MFASMDVSALQRSRTPTWLAKAASLWLGFCLKPKGIYNRLQGFYKGYYK